MKRPLQRVYDPQENTTHIQSAPGADAVTLCGQTDWLGNKGKPDYDTKRPVNCKPCKDIFDYCNSGTWPK
jgi:hypothetical protein